MHSSDFLSSASKYSTSQSLCDSSSSQNGILPPPVPGVVKENLLTKQKGQSSWLISLALHGAVLLCLAGITLDPQIIHAPAIQIEQPIPEPEPEFVFEPEELEVSDEDLKLLGALSERGVTVAEAVSPTKGDVSFVPPVPSALLSDTVRIEPVSFESMGPNEVDQLIETIVGVNVGVAATGAAGAVDRLSLEIARSLEDAPTTVCWVFDQSVSLAGQRQEIASRLKRVFRELSLNDQGEAPDGLTNLVLAYGQRFQFVVNKPTRISSEVVEAIQGIEIDNSGVEKTFTAIRAAAERLNATRRVGRSSGMVVVFTDEVGDDQVLADQVAISCRRLGVSVCVVGVPAPFGQRFIEMKYVEFDPSYASVEDWAVVEQGPETLFPESIQVGENAFSSEAIDSGFGPFSLSKICYQTGGVYIAVHANRNVRGRVNDRTTSPMSSRIRYFFDPESLRDYQPDYLSATKLKQNISSNAAKQALVMSAAATNLKPMTSPETIFPKKSEGELANLLSLAQRSAAVLQPRIDVIYGQLLRGLPDRDRIQEERWKAGFDLAMGRILAMKVRTDAYNLMLARAKAGMQFKSPKSDTWVLRPSDIVNVGSRTEKFAEQARVYLQRVIEDHPGTPWAFLAEREFNQPLGYAWDEIHTGINDPPKPRPPGNNNRPMPSDDKLRSLGPPMPKRNLKRI
ncbi:MAG: VWA domain-containing protein [Planctomycetaceae bacterium]|nr:VWA domain-containing protein [Planctomycetaceae bacterium]